MSRGDYIVYNYMGFRLEIKSVYWYFKDSAQSKLEHPYIWYAMFFLIKHCRSII